MIYCKTFANVTMYPQYNNNFKKVLDSAKYHYDLNNKLVDERILHC
jgi:hypothetical protein